MGIGRREYCVTLSEQKFYCELFNLNIDSLRLLLLSMKEKLESNEIETKKTGNKTKQQIISYLIKNAGCVGA